MCLKMNYGKDVCYVMIMKKIFSIYFFAHFFKISIFCKKTNLFIAFYRKNQYIRYKIIINFKRKEVYRCFIVAKAVVVM